MKIFGSSLTQILQALGLSSSGGTGQVLKQKTAGGAPVAEALAASDLLAALASGKYAVLPFSNVAGTANAITADSGVTLAAGQFFSLVVGTTSTSTTVNLNPDGTSNKRIKGPDGRTDPAVGDLIAGRVVILYYDGTSFRLLLGAPVSATDNTKLKLVGLFGKSSDQTIRSATATDITFTTHVVRPGSDIAHSTSSSPANVTINTAGDYLFVALIQTIPTVNAAQVDFKASLFVGATEKARTDYAGYQTTNNNYLWPATVIWGQTFAQNDVVKLQTYGAGAGGGGHTIKGQTSSIERTLLLVFKVG